jgi:hypothetical protein
LCGEVCGGAIDYSFLAQVYLLLGSNEITCGQAGFVPDLIQLIVRCECWVGKQLFSDNH